MNYLNLSVLLMISILSEGFASSIIENFTEDDIQSCAHATVQMFNNQPFGEYRILEENSQVGAIALDLDKDQVTIAYRGARGLQELQSCFSTSVGDTHGGFLGSFNKFKSSLFDGLDKLVKDNEDVSLKSLNYRIVGHSKGSAFVPLTVESLLDVLEIPQEQVNAITFSPQVIYAREKRAEYNQRFGKELHLNFQIAEDTVVEIAHVVQGILSRSINFLTVGETISYSALENENFKSWVEHNPYVHLDNSAQFLKFIIPASHWGAHMPEAYEITAPQAFAKVKDTA
jgi:hypothetical protein